MALTKVTYVDDTTVIEAQNLNDIQDAVIDTVPKSTGGTFSGNVTIEKPSTNTTDTGWCGLVVGNSTPTGTVGASWGHLELYGRNQYKHNIMGAYTMTADRDITLPDATGTVVVSSASVQIAPGTTSDTLTLTDNTQLTWKKFSQTFTLSRKTLVSIYAIAMNNTNNPAGLAVGNPNSGSGVILEDGTTSSPRLASVLLNAGTYAPWVKTGVTATSTNYAVYITPLIYY